LAAPGLRPGADVFVSADPDIRPRLAGRRTRRRPSPRLTIFGTGTAHVPDADRLSVLIKD